MEFLKISIIIVKDGEGLKDAIMGNSIWKTSDSGVLQVNKNHMYFYRVQQQRYVVKRLYRVLSIVESNEEFFCTEVSFEHEWWKEKQKNTEQFYAKYIMYELAYPRLRHGLFKYSFNWPHTINFQEIQYKN